MIVSSDRWRWYLAVKNCGILTIRSLTVNVLQGEQQEHRNMPIDEAVSFIAKNFSKVFLDYFVKKTLCYISVESNFRPPRVFADLGSEESTDQMFYSIFIITLFWPFKYWIGTNLHQFWIGENKTYYNSMGIRIHSMVGIEFLFWSFCFESEVEIHSRIGGLK